jgi:hypothetical protein
LTGLGSALERLALRILLRLGEDWLVVGVIADHDWLHRPGESARRRQRRLRSWRARHPNRRLRKSICL